MAGPPLFRLARPWFFALVTDSLAATHTLAPDSRYDTPVVNRGGLEPGRGARVTIVPGI